MIKWKPHKVFGYAITLYVTEQFVGYVPINPLLFGRELLGEKVKKLLVGEDI